MSAPWLNPAGGLRYHARGFRYAKTLWYGFRFALAEWLYEWKPPEKRLLLVGPSAGYCFQPFFFERFEEVLCLEPDPVARHLFAFRLRRAPLESRPRLRFESDDLLLDDPERFRARLEAEGDIAVLFSNIVGQFRVLLEARTGDDARLARLRSLLLPALGERSYASFHDRVSGTLEPLLDGSMTFDRRLTDRELVEQFYPGHDEPDALVRADGSAPLLDHLTGDFFPATRPHAYFSWQLMPGIHHLIEGTARTRG
ncbi:MAG TPA: hypothetical protein VFZ53_33680 [Polyangiaceae bacterium]